MNKEQLFAQLKEQHPEWSDEQIWTQVSVMLSADEAISQNPHAQPTDVDFIRVILYKAQEWLQDNLPEIFDRVADFLNLLISRLPDWAKNGIQFVGILIAKYIK